MMVRHFGAVHTPGIQVGQVKGFPVCLEIRYGYDFFQQGRNDPHDIFRNMAAAGSRIGNEFLLIQGLGYGKGLFCRQVIMGVAVFLQGCQVVEKRWLPEDPLAFQSCDCRLRTGADVAECRFRSCLVLEFLRMDELPVRLSLCQRDMQLPIRNRHEIPVLLETGTYHGECRSLHPSDGIIDRTCGYRQRSAGVHAHQPVSLCPAVSGRMETVIVAAIPEIGHTFPDSLVCQR